MKADENEYESYESESRGCLLILASYADLADAVAPVASEAARRIMMLPTLGDFVELRYASLGPRPRQDYERPFAVSRMAAEISRPTAAAAQNYFAMAIIDRSAATIERFLVDCTSSLVISALPLRRCGFAVTDDRTSGGEPTVIPPVKMVIPMDHRWTQRTLTDALRHYAEDLFLDFGAVHERGLMPEQLEALRTDIGSAAASAQTELSDTDRELNLLPADQRPDDSESPAKKPVQQALPPDQWDSVPVPADHSAPPVTQVREVTRSAPTADFYAESQRGLALPAPPPSQITDSASALPIAPKDDQRQAPALLFLIPVGGVTSRDRGFWKRARSLLLELDTKLARRPGPAWKVRFAPDPSRIKESVLQDAGQLSRRDFRRTSASLDFAQSLTAMRTVLHRDLAAIERSAGTAEVAVIVLFAIEAPLADAVTTKEYEQLAGLSCVIWVVPEAITDLLSPVFAAGGRLLADYPGVGDEIVSMLGISAVPDSPIGERTADTA